MEVGEVARRERDPVEEGNVRDEGDQVEQYPGRAAAGEAEDGGECGEQEQTQRRRSGDHPGSVS